MSTLTFKPKQVTKRLLSILPHRAQDVMVNRYGLGKNSEKMTLESIGEKYNITRERVRQIENHSIQVIRKSKEFQKEKKAFDELEAKLKELGGIMVEEDLLNTLSKDEGVHNHLHFLLILGHPFRKKKEDDHFKHRWYVDEELSEKVHGSLQKLYASLSDQDVRI